MGLVGKSKAKARDTRGRVCGVCIAGLVSGIASGKIALGKKRGRSGGADTPIYRAEFDRPYGLSPSGYNALVKLEGEALTQAQIREAMLRWNVGVKVFERASGKALWTLGVMPDGRVVVEIDWIKVRREQEESALRGPSKRGKSAGVWIGAAALAALAAYTFTLPKADRPPHGDGPGYYVFLFDKEWDGPYTTRKAAEARAEEALAFWNRPGSGSRGMARPTVRHLERAPFSDSKGNVSGRTRKGRSGSSVAGGILEQLGGNKFLAMTGAKQLMSFDTPGYGGLQFKLPKSGARAKLGIDAVRITLEDNDTYTMRFYKGMQEVRAIGALYSDNLRQAFTSVTGLETSLGTMGRSAGEKEPTTWGVFPWTPDSSPSAGPPVPNAAQGGYVVREANRKTGKGMHWPYSQVEAVKLYWRRHLADMLSTRLTYSKKR